MHTLARLPSTSPSVTAEASAAKARPAHSNESLIKRANEPLASQGPRIDAPKRLKPDIGRMRARHLSLSERVIGSGSSARRVTVDEAESPLVWLARRAAAMAARSLTRISCRPGRDCARTSQAVR